MPSPLDDFHPAVRAWFERRFDAPSRAQELGWPVIGAANEAPGFDVLLCAPTGSGKTLAAFMWAINGLVLDAASDQLRDEVSVLYVSPLKALANDIRLNLEEPLHGVSDVGAESGLDLSRIRAGLRTGDTSASERTAMLRRPPHILVTTPESLFILLTSPKFREKLAAVRHVIVDELHALAGNKRGAHLALTLERLERFVTSRGNARPNRIGLSATLNPIEKLAGFLAGYDVTRDGARIAASNQDSSRRRSRPRDGSAGHRAGPGTRAARDASTLGSDVRRGRAAHQRASHDAGLHAEPPACGARRDQSAEAARHRRRDGASWQPRARRASARRATPQARRVEGDRRDRVARTRYRRRRGRPRMPARYAQIYFGRDSAYRPLGAQPRRDTQGTLLRADHRRSARMRCGGARDSSRASRRSGNPDGMRRYRSAANRRDRRRGRRNLRGRSAARDPQRVQFRRSRRR